MNTLYHQVRREPASFTLPESLSNMAERYIETAIVEGRLASGTRLKPEDIAKELNISKSPVREALILLQRAGLVTGKPRSVFVVSEISLEDLQEIYPIRASLNELAIKIILQSPSATSIIEELAEHLEDMRKRVEADDIAGYFHSISEFYNFLILSCPNQRLQYMWCQLSKQVLRFRFLVMSQQGHIKRSYKDHVRLVAMMREGNLEKSIQCTREIIYSALEDLTVVLSSEAK